MSPSFPFRIPGDVRRCELFRHIQNYGMNLRRHISGTVGGRRRFFSPLSVSHVDVMFSSAHPRVFRAAHHQPLQRSASRDRGAHRYPARALNLPPGSAGGAWLKPTAMVLFGLWIVLGGACLCYAKTATIALTGHVTNASGFDVSGARVVLSNARNVPIQTVTANHSGIYTIAPLPPGLYHIVISAAGYQYQEAVLKLRKAGKRHFDAVLVPLAGKAVLPGRVVAGGVVSSKTVRNMPLNGRSTTSVAVLEPGVTSSRAGSVGAAAQHGFGSLLTISGGRPRENDYLQDGVSVTDYANSPPGSAAGVNLGVDAVKQVGVMEGVIPANYGDTAGGIVNFVTRSGGPVFHGDVFEFARNSVFDAKTFFNIHRPPFSRNQFGGTLGGPIRRGRAYFFASYEGFRQSLGISQVDTVPTQQARAGHLSSGTVAVNPAVTRFMNAFIPLPNGAILPGGDTGIFNFAGQQVIPENYLDTRVDFKRTSRDKMHFTYLRDNATVRQPDEFNNKLTGYDSKRDLYTFFWSHSYSANFVNTVRFGFYHVFASTGLTFPLTNAAMSNPAYGTVPGANVPAVSVTGLTTFSGGIDVPSNYVFHWNSIQGYDNISYTHGRQVIQAGFMMERNLDDILGISNPGGSFIFNSLSDFLTNQPYSLSAAVPGLSSTRDLRQTIFGAYVEDHWSATPRLNVNAGLRYEPISVPGEAHGHLTVLRHLTSAKPRLGGPLWVNSTKLNIEPRIGIAFDPRGNGNTLLGVGFGIFDVLPLLDQVQFNEVLSAPYFEALNAQDLPAGSFPSEAYAVADTSNSSRQAYFQHRPHRSYAAQWNLSIQQRLTRQLSLTVGYLGARGIHLPFRVEGTDIVLPTRTPQGYLWPFPIGSGHRLNPHAGRLTSGWWTADSYYDALQTHLIGSIGSVHLQTSYTWGKTIDDSSADMTGNDYNNSIGSPLYFDPGLNRGLADFNIAQNLEVDSMWSPNWGGGFSAPMRRLVHGWQLGGVLNASTGVPFTAQIGGDALGVKSSDPLIDLPNAVAGPGCGRPVYSGNPFHYIRTHCFAYPHPVNLRGDLGRNTLPGPDLVDLASSLIKNTPVNIASREVTIQLRAEFFNVLNHANFAPPLNNRFLFVPGGARVPNAGLITTTETQGREIQFAVKALF